MDLKQSTDQLLGVFRLLTGFILVWVFFLPLYTSALFEVSGPKILEFIENGPDGKFRMVDKFTGFLMLFVPAFSVFIGCFSTGLGIYQLTGKQKLSRFFLSVPSWINVVLAIVCAWRLEHGVSGFFASLAPKAGTAFYGMLVVLVLVALGPVLIQQVRNMVLVKNDG